MTIKSMKQAKCVTLRLYMSLQSCMCQLKAICKPQLMNTSAAGYSVLRQCDLDRTRGTSRRIFAADSKEMGCKDEQWTRLDQLISRGRFLCMLPATFRSQKLVYLTKLHLQTRESGASVATCCASHCIELSFHFRD